jgi:hypothetical protein
VKVLFTKKGTVGIQDKGYVFYCDALGPTYHLESVFLERNEIEKSYVKEQDLWEYLSYLYVETGIFTLLSFMFLNLLRILKFPISRASEFKLQGYQTVGHFLFVDIRSPEQLEWCLRKEGWKLVQ